MSFFLWVVGCGLIDCIDASLNPGAISGKDESLEVPSEEFHLTTPYLKLNNSPICRVLFCRLALASSDLTLCCRNHGHIKPLATNEHHTVKLKNLNCASVRPVGYLYFTLSQKRNAAQLTRLKKQLPEAVMRNQQKKEHVRSLEQSLAQMEQNQDKQETKD